MDCEAYGNPGQRGETRVKEKQGLITQRSKVQILPRNHLQRRVLGTGGKVLILRVPFGDKFSAPAR
jgi:hypothetical protein